MSNDLAAFVSYAHADDEFDGGGITHFAQTLERAIKAFTGKSEFSVFLDRKSLAWGDAWRDRIKGSLDAATSLVAIVTPNYLASRECQCEVLEFLGSQRTAHWLLPIHYIEVVDLESRRDPVATALRAHQSIDWRELRVLGRKTIRVRKAIERLARTIRDRLREGDTTRDSLPSCQEQGIPRDSYPAASARAQTSDWYDDVLGAQAAVDEEEYELARAILLEALERFPSERTELLYELAIVDWYQGAIDVAVEGFLAAMRGGLDELDVFGCLGQTRIDRGEFTLGIEELSHVVLHHSDHIAQAYARSGRALGLGGLGRFQEALDDLALAERVTPHNAWLHFNRGRVFDWQGERTAASESYLRSLIVTDPPLTRLKRRFAQRRLGDFGR